MKTTPHHDRFTIPIVLLMAALMVFAQTKEGFGQVCTVCNSTCGTGAAASGACAFAAGDASNAIGDGSAALVGGYAKWDDAFAVGSSSIAHSFRSIAIGSKIDAWSPYSVALGHRLAVDTLAFRSMVFGFGNDILLNDVPQSMMFGMNSNVSTIFIGNSGGASGSYGNVGIGNITAPASLLHVRDQVRVGLTSGANGSVVFNNTAGNIFSLTAPSTMANQPLILPVTAGVAGEILGLDAGGTQLKWLPGTSGGAGWLLVGNGGTIAGTNFLGTTDPVDLVFKTNSTEKVRVMSGGNVGIGTASPVGKLHVNSTAGNTDLVISRPASQAGRLVFLDAATESANIRLDAAVDLIVENDRSNEDIYFKINDEGVDTEVMRIQGSTSRVGIGTAAPLSKLHVIGPDTQNDVARFSMTGATANQMLLIGNANTISSTTNFEPYVAGRTDTVIDSGLWLWAETPSGTGPAAMIYRVATPGAAGPITGKDLFEWRNGTTPIMEVDANGNLGIGLTTTTPVARLHVETTDTHLARFLYSDGGSTRPRLDIFGAGNLIRLKTFYASGGADLALGTVAAQNAVYIKEAGNVGIGTASPASGARLHVNGRAYVTDIPAGSGIPVYQNTTTGLLNDGTGSSIHFKDQIEPLVFDKEAFLTMRPVAFKWKEFYGGQNDVGFVAQEVAEAFNPLTEMRYALTYLPNGDIMRDDSTGVPVQDSTTVEPFGVKYHKLPIYLYSLAQHQDSVIQALRTRLETLETMVSSCCHDNQPQPRLQDPTGHNNLGKMKEPKEVILLQNDPNPFSDHTEIKVSFDRPYQSASVMIVDSNSRMIRQFDVESGQSVRVYGSEIGSGVFTYHLILDGVIVMSRKMVSSR